jgi:amidase
MHAAKDKVLALVDYIAAKRHQQELIVQFTTCMEGFDALLTITASGEAPEGLSDTGNAAFCTPFTFLGAPAITMPAGWSTNGLPLGIQLASDWGKDNQLLSVATWVEKQLKSFFSPKTI